MVILWLQYGLKEKIVSFIPVDTFIKFNIFPIKYGYYWATEEPYRSLARQYCFCNDVKIAIGENKNYNTNKDKKAIRGENINGNNITNND